MACRLCCYNTTTVKNAKQTVPHLRTPPFSGNRDEETGLANGAPTIETLDQSDFTWDSAL